MSEKRRIQLHGEMSCHCNLCHQQTMSVPPQQRKCPRHWCCTVLLLLLVNQLKIAASADAVDRRPIDAPLLNNLASNLYAEFFQHRQQPSEPIKQTIRQRISEFVQQFGGHNEKANRANAARHERTKRDAFGYRSALVDSSK